MKGKVFPTMGWFALAVTLLIWPVSSASAQPKANRAESETIDRLIGQLGSPSFFDREAASQALQKIGTKALEPLRAVAKNRPTLEVRRRAATLVEQIENSLETLLEASREFGLPLPPARARLVRFGWGNSNLGTGGNWDNTPLLGFVLRGGKEGELPLLLVGTEEYVRPIEMEKYSGKLQLFDVDPKAALPNQVYDLWQYQVHGVSSWGRSAFEINAGLATAIQCKAQGFDVLAQVLWNRCATGEAGHHNSIFYHPPNLPPRQALAQLAWVHIGNELAMPKSDRAVAVTKIKALMKAEPFIASDQNKEVLHSLELAIVPSKAQFGTAERLIDDLVDLSGPWTNAGVREADPHYRRVSDLGFAAVPTLIEHLDDQRLTRLAYPGFGNSPPRISKIGELVHSVLYGIAGFDVIRQWRHGSADPIGEKEDARKWFVQAQQAGEEAYYVKHLFPSNPKDERFNDCMLNLIAVKYPKQLPAIYRKILDTHSQLTSWPVAEALAESSFPTAEKMSHLTYATKNAKKDHREAALWFLKKLEDHKSQPPEMR